MGTLVVCVLLLPVTPLAFYLVTFWKDVWVLLGFVAVIAISAGGLTRRREGGRLVDLLPIGLLTLSASLALLARHNALVCLPAFVLIAYAYARQRGLRKWWGLAAAGALVLVAGGFRQGLPRLVHAREEYPTQQLHGVELVGLCAVDEENCELLPHTASHLIMPDWRRYYQFGYAGSVIWEKPQLLHPAYWQPEVVAAEYWRAARLRPWDLAEVKWRAFCGHLGLSRTHYWFHTDIARNELGLQWSVRFARAREALLATGLWVARHPVLRWISGVHLVWLVWCCGATVVALVRWWYDGTPARLLVLGWWLMALSYYASYLLATVAHDFRFMYPATFVTQLLLVSSAAGWLWRQATPGGFSSKRSRLS